MVSCPTAITLAGSSATERQLETFWQGPIKRRATHWRSFWRNVRLWWKYRVGYLHTAQLRPTMKLGTVPDCQRCTDNCCRGPNIVSLRLQDVARLVDAGLGWAITTPSRRGIKRSLELEGGGSATRFPILKHNERGDCVFLNPTGRCQIYPIRPLTCQRFPYVLSDDLRHVHYSQVCRFPSSKPAQAQSQSMLRSVARSYNARMQDLVFLEYGQAELIQLGLHKYLPDEAAKEHPFAKVLQQQQTRQAPKQNLTGRQE